MSQKDKLMQLVSQLTLLQPDLWDLVTGPSLQFTKPFDLPSTVSPLLLAGGWTKWLGETHGSCLVVNVGDLLLEGLFFSVFFWFFRLIFSCFYFLVSIVFCFHWLFGFCWTALRDLYPWEIWSGSGNDCSGLATAGTSGLGRSLDTRRWKRD